MLSVIDSIAENGAKLIESGRPTTKRSLRASMPGVRLVPEMFYEPLSLRLSLESALHSGRAQVSTVRVTVSSATNGNAPVRGVKVIGFTNFAQRAGAEGFTNAAGHRDAAVCDAAGERSSGSTSSPTRFLEQFAHCRADAGGVTMRSGADRSSPLPDVLRRDLRRAAAERRRRRDRRRARHRLRAASDLVIAGGFNAVTGENHQRLRRQRRSATARTSPESSPPAAQRRPVCAAWRQA